MMLPNNILVYQDDNSKVKGIRFCSESEQGYFSVSKCVAAARKGEVNRA